MLFTDDELPSYVPGNIVVTSIEGAKYSAHTIRCVCITRQVNQADLVHRSSLAQRLHDTSLQRLQSVTAEHELHTAYTTLPPLSRLRPLHIRLRGRRTAATISHPAFLDFGLQPALAHLHIEGDLWTGFQDLFCGVTTHLRTCILEGSLVVNAQVEGFFERISNGLSSLYCIGTHISGSVRTVFPALRLLSFHRLLHWDSILPFPNTEISTLCVEGEEYNLLARDDNDFDTLLEINLLRYRSSLRHLFLRSAAAWKPRPSLMRFIRHSRLESILLDGAIMLNNLDLWYITSCSTLELVISVPDWPTVCIVRIFGSD